MSIAEKDIEGVAFGGRAVVTRRTADLREARSSVGVCTENLSSGGGGEVRQGWRVI
jgi:hypothetical protein